MVRTAAGKARASVKTVRASVKTAVCTHRSFAIVRVSGKEQQELAMCWRCDRVSKTHGSAIVIDTRTEGSKGLGHRSPIVFKKSQLKTAATASPDNAAPSWGRLHTQPIYL